MTLAATSLPCVGMQRQQLRLLLRLALLLMLLLPLLNSNVPFGHLLIKTATVTWTNVTLSWLLSLLSSSSSCSDWARVGVGR